MYSKYTNIATPGLRLLLYRFENSVVSLSTAYIRMQPQTLRARTRTRHPAETASPKSLSSHTPSLDVGEVQPEVGGLGVVLHARPPWDFLELVVLSLVIRLRVASSQHQNATGERLGGC